MVTETTWSRIINGIKKESLLDHVYVKNPVTVPNVFNKITLFGDHSLVLVELIFKQPTIKSHTKRNWKNYGLLNLQCKLAEELALVYYRPDLLSVQDHWFMLETVLINVIDAIASLTSANFKIKPFKNVPPQSINAKLTETF